jgi:hypothetical protein
MRTRLREIDRRRLTAVRHLGALAAGDPAAATGAVRTAGTSGAPCPPAKAGDRANLIEAAEPARVPVTAGGTAAPGRRAGSAAPRAIGSARSRARVRKTEEADRCDPTAHPRVPGPQRAGRAA